MEQCTKKTFDTMEEANQRAQQLTAQNRKGSDSTKLRPYQCVECGLFHLTSMSKKKHKFLTDSSYRHSVKEQQFIEREAAHWNAKFGIEE